MAHWHDCNPWADRLIYLPSLEAFALCHAGLGKYCDCSAVGGRAHQKMTMGWIIAHYTSQHTRVDAYILPSPDGHHSLGLRFGPNGQDYYSPECNHQKASEMIRKFGGHGGHAHVTSRN